MFSDIYPIGGEGYESQVIRFLAFREAHPGWEIHYSFGHWRAWRELPNGGEEHVRTRLLDLLDTLEQIALREGVPSRGRDENDRGDDAGNDHDPDG